MRLAKELLVASSDSLVKFDAVGAGNNALLTSAGITNAHTLGAAASGIIVGVTANSSGKGYANVASNSCLIGSTSLSLLGHINCNNTAGIGWVELWGLAFTAGAFTGAQTITCKEVLTGTIYPYTYIQSVSYTNVASFDTAITNFGPLSGWSSGSVTSRKGDRVVAVFGGGTHATTSAVTGGGTQRYNNSPPPPTNWIAEVIQDTAGASTRTLTCNTNLAWGSVAVNMRHL